MSSFSLSGGVEVMGFISPTDTNDTYPVIDPLYGVDGFRNVNTLSDLDLIPEPRRRAGMVVGVSGGTDYYKLNSSPWNFDFTDWSVFNTGGSASGYYLPLSGGTVTGNTVFTLGLSVNTISATTYQNLPTDIRVTGGTYSNGTSTFTNNTGGTFSVTGFSTDNTFTGGTVTGTTTFTNGLTSNIISATTYQNLPTDVRVTGGTYSNGVSIFTNNTGGTFNVVGFYTGSTDNNQYVTGFTYSSNTFTILDNSGNTFNSTFNVVTGLTVNGVLSATTISGDSYTITTQTQDNTLENFLVVDPNGDFYVRNYDSINYIPNLVTVGLSGGSAQFTSVKAAVDSITGATASNPFVVIVGPGLFIEDPITMKSYVDIVGESATNTIIQANNPNTSLIIGADQSMVNNVQIQGCTGTNVAAIVYSSSTTPQLNAIFYVENVRFGTNYTHVKNVGTGGGNSIIQCSNVKYGGYPFTLGFYCTNDGSGVGRMQLRNVTSTNGGVTTTTGLVFAKADKTGCGFIVNGCLLTKAAGAAAGTGFWVEDGAFLRLTGVNFQRWVTGIYVPQVGSAPSIDAIALNFETCTTDVNIIHSGTTGKIQGTDNFLKTLINVNAPIYEVNTDPRELTVAKKGGDFSSVKAAVDYLIASGNTSSTNRYVISVGPGEFTENEIDLTSTPYVSIVGSNIQTTLIKPNTNTQHIIKLGINNEISFLSLSGAPSGYAGLYVYDIGDFGQAHKVSLYDCDTNVWVESDTQDTKFYGEYLDFNGEYTYGTKVIGNNGYLALANIENYYNFPTGSNITYCNYATGSGATISAFVGDNVSNGVSGSTAYYAQDGAGLYCSTITIDGFTYGIRNPNIGDPIRFDIDNASIVGCEWDLYVERSTTFGTFGGSSSHEKVFTNSPDVYWLFLDIDDGELDLTRKASVTFADGTHTDLTTLVFQGSTMGLMSGGSITTISGFTVSTATGFGYLSKTLSPEVIMRIDWVDSQIVLGANENKYLYINENSILSASGTKPSSVNNILLGRVVTNSTGVSFIDLSPAHSDHTSNRYGNLFRNALGPIYSNGSIVTENATPFRLNVTTGEYYYSSNMFMPSGGTSINFTQYYRDGSGGWITSATTVVNNTSYDGNGSLSALTTNYYTKHTLYVVGENGYENYFLVLGQNEYSTLVQAEDALLPTPPTFFTDSVVQVANIYIEQGASGITQVEDVRPVIGFKAGGVNASSVHGNLLGLAADDHTQYLLVDGSRAMSGDLSLGGNSLTNILTANGVTIEAHATRHQFGGLDPVGSTTPSANAIPYADVSGTLDSWVSTATTTTLGKVKLSTTPVSTSNPIVIGDNDIRVARSLTGGTYSNGTATFTNNTGGTITLTGLTTTSGNSPQVGFFSGGTNLTGSNNLIYSGGTLQVRATGSTSSDIPFRIRNSGDTADLISFRSDGSEWVQLVPFRHASFLTGTNNTSQGLFLGYNVASLSTTSTNAVIIGRGSGAILQGNGNTIIGDGFSHGTVSNSIGLGRGVFVNGSNQFVSGSELYPTNTWLVSTGGEVNSGSNLRGLDFKVSGMAAGPSNISAQPYPVRFYSPNGTGSGLGSNIQFYVAPSNTGGASFNKNVFSEMFTIRGESDGLNHYQLSTPRIPSSGLTDGYIQYSNDITAGNAAPHFRTEAGNIVKLYTHSAVTTTQGIANALTTLGLLSASTIATSTDVFVTGGTKSGDSLIFTNNTGGTFNVTGITDTNITGATYNNNTFTYTNNTGGTFSVLFNTVTGLTTNGNLTVTGTTSSGTISATTYQNLPTDVRVTGGTYGNGTAIFTNNTGGTFNVTGFLSNATTAVTLSSNVLSVTSSGGTPTTTTINAATGGTYSNGTITLSGTGTLSPITGLFTSADDVRVTGGTYSSGTATFTNNTGGTFNVTGFYTSANDTFVTGVTYSANTLTIKRNQSQPDLTTTVGLITKSNTVAAGSFTGLPKKYTVLFTTPYSTTNYSINITGSDSRTFTYESKTVNGFIINTNANAALTGNVDWMTISIGES